MKSLFKPEYAFHPSQVFRRILRRRDAAPQRRLVRLPWHLPFEISTADEIGLAIWQLGIYDLAVCETAWRLLDEGETACDVGANIGYLTSLLAARAGPAGRVLAFEPHPAIHGELAAQVARWPAHLAAPVELHRSALSERPGTAWLHEPGEFDHNRGTSTLESPDRAHQRGYEVPTFTLDSLPASDRGIGLLKVDVEGHELAVFRGGRSTLARGDIRDIIFEEHHGYPSPVCSFLQELGFTLYRIGKAFRGPRLQPPEHCPSEDWLPPSFLATRKPDRTRDRLAPRGWRVLRPH